MDFLKKGEQMLGGQGGQGQNMGQNQGGQGAGMGGGMGGGVGGGNQQNEDYGDKGLDFIEKKTGHNMGRNTNEKITDGVRNAYEKATGNAVNPKWSN